MLTGVVGWAVTGVSLGRADEQKPREPKKEQGIHAEVTGTLHFEAGHGYYITVKPAEKAGHETRVWLWVAEDKEMVRKLHDLNGKKVTASGSLSQMPAEVTSNVPSLGLYLRHDFKIEPGGAK